MKDFLPILFFGLLAASGAWYYYRASIAKIGIGGRIGLAILGGVLFVVIFGVTNYNISHHMPRWFYRFIRENGDPAGFCLVMISCALLNLIIPVAISVLFGDSNAPAIDQPERDNSNPQNKDAT